MSANVAYTMLANPLNIISYLHESWTLGRFLCTFHQYALWVLQGQTMHFHLLITINRIWAITFPLSYRNCHSKKVAYIITFAAIVYVHLFCVPGVLVEVAYSRLDLEKFGCSFDGKPIESWQKTVMIIIYDMPIFLMGAVYPFLWYKQKKINAAVSAHLHQSRKGSHIEMDHISTSGPRKYGSEHGERKSSSRKSFVVLTALTMSEIICWSPLHGYYTAVTFFRVENNLFRNIAEVMFSLQAVFDPILIVITMGDLRRKVLSFFRCR